MQILERLRQLFLCRKDAGTMTTCLTVGFCFCNRDFPTASPGVYAILCLCKGTQAESAYAESAQESTLRGFRREVRFIMSPPGKRRHNELNAAPPPRPPGERVQPVATSTEIGCRAEKASVFGRNLFARRDARRGNLCIDICSPMQYNVIKPSASERKNYT